MLPQRLSLLAIGERTPDEQRKVNPDLQRVVLADDRDELLTWLENESKRANRPKSAVVREILQQHQQSQPRNALDMASDMCGCAQSGLRSLSRNMKHLKGFGR